MNKIITLLSMTVFAAGHAMAACNTNMAESTPTSRFFNNGDGTVIDSKTGLMWRRCPIDYGLDNNGTPDDMTDDACTPNGGAPLTYSWGGALNEASNLVYPVGSHNDWRLASIKELSTIIERQCDSPATNAVVFPNTPSARFWSSSPDADSGGVAWYVDFADSGRVNNDDTLGLKSVTYHAYVVRGGP